MLSRIFLYILIIGATSDGVPLSTQVHLALIPPDKVSISWVTNASYTNSPIVYISSNNPKTNNITVNSSQITAFTQSNAGISRYYHHAITQSLMPGQQYWYQPGPNASIYSFIARTLDAKTSNHLPFSFLAFGDLGVTNSKNTVQLIHDLANISSTNSASDTIDFILHFGDISYADDGDHFSANPAYTTIYDEWGNMMEPIFSAVPYMTSPGNHEQTCHSWSDFQCHSDLENFTVYREYFRMPSATHNEVGGGVMNMWWSMDYKNIHILTISTETDYPGSPDQGDYHHDIINPEAGPFGNQMKFVEDDLLKAYNNPDIDWIIVNGHRPYYTSAYHGTHQDWPPQTPKVLREAFEPLFYKYNVDLYISGHIHAYERLYPMYKEKVTTKDYLDPLSTIYMVVGCAGSVEGHEYTAVLKEYTAVYNNTQYGISKVTVMNDTHLLWQFIGGDDQSVLDSVWIKKGHWAN